MTHPLVTAARKYLGCRFRHRGRGPAHFDCAGLILQALKDCGAHGLYDLPTYGREPHRDGLREAVRRNLGEPVSGVWQPGDVALMAFETEPMHVALLGDYPHGGLSVIHAYAAVRRVVEHRMDATWADRVVEVYRWAS